MALCFVIIFILFVICCRKRETSAEQVSSADILPFRGVLSVAIIFVHLSDSLPENDLFSRFSWLGYVVVGVFFALSGYGLMSSYMAKGDDYRKGFLWKRLSKILIPYLLFTLIYIAFNSTVTLIKHESISEYFASLFVSIKEGGQIVTYSWYVEAALLFYVVFYVACLLSKNNNNGIIAIVFALTVVYTLLLIVFKADYWWYNAIFAFPFGMLLKKLESEYNGFKSPILLIISGVLFLLTFWFKRLSTSLLPDGVLVYTIVSNINVCLFSFFLIGIIRRFRIKSRVIDFLGKISFETYMAHGLAMVMIRNSALYVQNDILYSVFVLAITFGVATIVFYIDKFALRLLKIR